MTPTAIEIGGLALIVGVSAFAQRLGGWENKPLAVVLAVAAAGLFVAWCFLFIPTPVAWGGALLAWSIGLWFLFPLGRKLIEAMRAPPAVIVLPLVETDPNPTVAFEVVAKVLWRETDPKPKFRSKLRVTITSRISEGVDVLAPDWEAGKGYVPAQLPQGFCSLRLEGPLGWKAVDWLHEVGRLHVLPGQTFQLWIGLDQSFSDSDLESRHAQHHLGTLVVPVKISGKYSEFRQRF